MPGELAALMWASRLFNAEPTYYLLVIHATLSLLSTACMFSFMGRAVFGPLQSSSASAWWRTLRTILVACYLAEPVCRAQITQLRHLLRLETTASQDGIRKL